MNWLYVTGYRYMIHLYCLAVQAGFYSDAVECRTLSPADRVRSPAGEKYYFNFFTCYIYTNYSFYFSLDHQCIEREQNQEELHVPPLRAYPITTLHFHRSYGTEFDHL